MPEHRPNRINSQLDDEHAAKLQALADRTSAQAGAIARSLISTALDQADPNAKEVSALLDAIPGAWKRAQQGLADVAAGRVVPVDEI